MRSGRITIAADPPVPPPSSTAAPSRVSQRRAHRRAAVRLEHVGVEDVGSAQESGDVRGRGRGVDLLRRADLLDPALGQDGDLVAHGQRLLLVVGDVDERDADLALQRRSSSCSCLRSLASSAPSGSSSSSTSGRSTSARASATRCCWPPESWAGLRLAKSPIRTSSSASPTRRLVSSPGRLLVAAARTRRCPTRS